MFSYEFSEISKNTFFHRTPLVADSVFSNLFALKESNIFFVFFQKLKQNTVFSFLLPLINTDITHFKNLELLSILMFLKKFFWRKFLNKFPAVYNWFKCLSLEIALEISNQTFSK